MKAKRFKCDRKFNFCGTGAFDVLVEQDNQLGCLFIENPRDEGSEVKVSLDRKQARQLAAYITKWLNEGKASK